jgi:hypothetical protein
MIGDNSVRLEHFDSPFALSLWFDKLTTIGLSLSKARHRLVEGCLFRNDDEQSIIVLVHCSSLIVQTVLRNRNLYPRTLIIFMVWGRSLRHDPLLGKLHDASN